VLGVASAAAWVERTCPRARPLAVGVLAMLMAWNVGFMFQWGTNLVPNRGPVDFRTVARNQVTVVPERLVVFAWRYLTNRQGLTSDVEQQDLIERRRYELKR